MRTALSALGLSRPFQLAAVAGQALFGQWLALLMVVLLAVFAHQAQAVPMALWAWVDVLGEGGMALMLAVWLVQLRASRPAGRVTTWLCLGLAALMLGQWVDLLDEFWRLPKTVWWDNALESSLMPLGMGTLTYGLHLLRQEQLVLTESLRRRERLFREHRSLDGVTQLGDASYMGRQIALERERGQPGTVLMLSWQGFDAVLRQHGLIEAERMLQAGAQLLLLQLRQDDLLCRYGASCFVVLLPGTTGQAAAELGADLQTALTQFAFPMGAGAGAVRQRLPVGMASSPVQSEAAPAALLLNLLERT